MALFGPIFSRVSRVFFKFFRVFRVVRAFFCARFFSPKAPEPGPQAPKSRSPKRQGFLKTLEVPKPRSASRGPQTEVPKATVQGPPERGATSREPPRSSGADCTSCSHPGPRRTNRLAFPRISLGSRISEKSQGGPWNLARSLGSPLLFRHFQQNPRPKSRPKESGEI